MTRPLPLRLAAAALVGLALTGCSLLDKEQRPTENTGATRVPADAPASTVRPSTRSTPTPTARPSSAAASSGAAASGTRPSTVGTPAQGKVEQLTTKGYGAVLAGGPAQATGSTTWDEDCMAWQLASDAGTVVGHALTSTQEPGGLVYTIRIESPSVMGPGNLHVGSTAADVKGALPRAAHASNEQAEYYHQNEGSWLFVAQVAKDSQRVTALMILPDDKDAEGFPSQSLC